MQNLRGISDEFHRGQPRRSGAAADELPVRLGLQADCLAGVWAHCARRARLLEPGGLDEALRVVRAVRCGRGDAGGRRRL